MNYRLTRCILLTVSVLGQVDENFGNYLKIQRPKSTNIQCVKIGSSNNVLYRDCKNEFFVNIPKGKIIISSVQSETNKFEKIQVIKDSSRENVFFFVPDENKVYDSAAVSVLKNGKEVARFIFKILPIPKCDITEIIIDGNLFRRDEIQTKTFNYKWIDSIEFKVQSIDPYFNQAFPNETRYLVSQILIIPTLSRRPFGFEHTFSGNSIQVGDYLETVVLNNGELFNDGKGKSFRILFEFQNIKRLRHNGEWVDSEIANPYLPFYMPIE
jgi:hypothetical protein